jgi:hypothetical protein
MATDARLQEIKEILEDHKGKSNQISAGEIGPLVGVEEDATHVQVRGLILQTIEEYRLPVAASSRGYYLIGTEGELNEYLDNIEGRIEEMKKRKGLVKDAYEHYYRNKA